MGAGLVREFLGAGFEDPDGVGAGGKAQRRHVQFAGNVWLDPIALPHEHGQYLRVTQGVARFRGRNGTIIELHPGQTLYPPPGGEHWHAAAPGCFMEHIAMLQNGEAPSQTTTWGDHITDDEYNGRQPPAEGSQQGNMLAGVPHADSTKEVVTGTTPVTTSSVPLNPRKSTFYGCPSESSYTP